jgi:hypothetical protein
LSTGFLSRLFRRTRFENPVIIVSGLPRSGTSMLMGMLSAGGVELMVDGVRTANEDNPKGYHELEQVKALDKPGDKAWLGAARGKALKIISFLLQHLPDTYDYKIIFLRRNLPEVLASQQKMLERRGEGSGDKNDDEMARMFFAHLTKIERVLANRENCDVLYVEHRDTVDNPSAVAVAINDFLGGHLDTRAMTAVVDPQLYRNRV